MSILSKNGKRGLENNEYDELFPRFDVENNSPPYLKQNSHKIMYCLLLRVLVPLLGRSAVNSSEWFGDGGLSRTVGGPLFVESFRTPSSTAKGI